MNAIIEIEKKALTIPEQAKQIAVTDNATFQVAAAFLLDVKALQKQINETFDPIVKKAHEAHKEAVAQKKKVEAPLLQAEALVKPQMAAYIEEQERRRRQEEARLQAEAIKRDEEARLAEATTLEKAGNDEEAARVISTPSFAAPVVAPKLTPKVEGVAAKQIWKWRITNSYEIPREYLIPNEGAITAVVRSLKGAANIPGVQVYAETNISAGRVA